MRRNLVLLAGIVLPIAIIAVIVMIATRVVNGAVLCSPQRCSSYTQILQAVPNTNVEQVEFRAPNGNKLYGVYLKQHKARYTILISHAEDGNMLTAFPLAMAMLEGGCNAFIYDYEGYGMSEGTASLTNMMNDGDAAFDCAMNQLRIKPSHMIAGGSGLGGCVANQMLAHNPMSGIIVVDAPARVRDVLGTKGPWMNLLAPFIHEYDTDPPTASPAPHLVLTSYGHNVEGLAPEINSFIRKF